MIDALAWLLLVLPAVDWTVAVYLTVLSRRRPDILTLRERAFAAAVCAVVASIAGMLSLVRLGLLHLDNGQAIGFLALALVISSVPNLAWLVLLLTGRFRFREP